MVGLSIFLNTAIVFAQEAVVNKNPTNAEAVSMLKKIVDIVVEALVKYSFQVFAGVLILIAGWIIGGFFAKFVRKFLNRYNLDVTIKKYIVSTSKLLVMVLACILALGKFGIEIAPIIAGLSVIGFATSFALQGPLSNYAAGVVLIFTKPFKVGDIIEVVNVMGEVEDMTLPRTILRTVDDTHIVIPNKHIIGEIIHNFTELKRLDIKINVSYKTDIDKAITIIKDIVKKDARLQNSQQVKIGITEFGDSGINLCARLWCKQPDYWDTMYSVNRSIYLEFKNNGIEIPYPRRDVYMHQSQG